MPGSEAHKQSAVHLTIDYVDVKLSLLWLLEGRGILKMCKASGIRGSIDRRFEGMPLFLYIALIGVKVLVILM